MKKKKEQSPKKNRKENISKKGGIGKNSIYGENFSQSQTYNLSNSLNISQQSQQSQPYNLLDTMNESKQSQTYNLSNSMNISQQSQQYQTYNLSNSMNISQQSQTYNLSNSMNISQQSQTYNLSNSMNISQQSQTYNLLDTMNDCQQSQTFNLSNSMNISQQSQQSQTYNLSNSMIISQQFQTNNLLDTMNDCQQSQTFNLSNSVNISQQSQQSQTYNLSNSMIISQQSQCSSKINQTISKETLKIMCRNEEQTMSNNDKKLMIKKRKKKEHKLTERERAMMVMGDIYLKLDLGPKKRIVNSNTTSNKQDYDEQVMEVIQFKDNCKYYCNFSYEQLELLTKYCTNVCKYDGSNNWIQYIPSKHIIKKKRKCAFTVMTDMFKVFYLCYYLKHFPTYYTFYQRMKLNRFYSQDSSTNSNDISPEKESTITSRCRRLLQDCINTYGEKLFNNTVRIRTTIDVKKRQTFFDGRVNDYENIISQIDKTIYAVDGRNQQCSNKFIAGTNILDTSYFNKKRNSSGMKSLVRVDPSGYACWVSDAFPAALNDSELHKMSFDDALIPEGYYEFADGGFIGCKRCIVPFRITTMKSFEKKACYISSQTNTCYLFGKYSEDLFVYELSCLCVGSIVGCKFEGYLSGNVLKVTCNEKYHHLNDLVHLKVEGEIVVDGEETKLTKVKVVDNIEVSNKERRVYVDFPVVLKCVETIDGIDYSVKLKRANPKVLKLFNSTLSSIRILVENFFGRMITLFRISKHSFNLDATMYSKINQILVALTNCHIFFNPLRKFPFFSFHIGNDSVETKYGLTEKIQKILDECRPIFEEKKLPEEIVFNEERKQLNEVEVMNESNVLQNDVDNDHMQECSCINETVMNNNNSFSDLIVNCSLISENTALKDSDYNIKDSWISEIFMQFTVEKIMCLFNENVCFIDYYYIVKKVNEANLTERMKNKIETLYSHVTNLSIVVIPICFHCHWFLLFKLMDKFYFIDSYNKEFECYSVVKECFDFITNKTGKTFNLNQIRVEQQMDYYSCGYRIILFILFIHRLGEELNPDKLTDVHFDVKMFDDILAIYKKFKEFDSKRGSMERTTIVSKEITLIVDYSNVLLELYSKFRQLLKN